MAKYRYRLLAGSHTEEVNGERKRYRAGDEFDSDTELDRRLNGPGSIKFQRLNGDTQGTVMAESLTDEQLIAELKRRKMPAEVVTEAVEATDDALEDYSVQELKDLADSDEIDLGNAKTKDAIIRVIRSARNAAAV